VKDIDATTAPKVAMNLLPVIDSSDLGAPSRLPRWLKRQVPKGNGNHRTARLLEELRLETDFENTQYSQRMY
jgi:lipoic acid synthetase